MENYWTIIKEVERLHYGQKRFLCRCICGKEKIVREIEIKYNRSRSCGCMRKQLNGESRANRKVKCICPMCRKTYMRKMVWTGNGDIPRFLCSKCKRLAFNGIDPDIRYLFNKDGKLIYGLEPNRIKLVDVAPDELVVNL